MNEAACYNLSISGLVQGVSYRASAIREAQRIGIDGWVRNRRDGTVEALAVGSHEAVEAFIDWCRTGPPAARVDRVEVMAADLPDGPGFRMLPDA